MTSPRGQLQHASLAGALAWVWWIWAVLSTWRGLHAQRYLEFGFGYLAITALGQVCLRGLPYLVAGIPVVVLAARLVRQPRFLAPVVLGIPSVAWTIARLPELNIALRPSLPARWLRAGALSGALLAALAIAVVLGILLSRWRVSGRLCTRLAGAIRASIERLRVRRPARLLGRRAAWGAAVVAAVAGSILPSIARPAAAGRPSVVILLIDTLRADHLGCYGYDRDTSPNVDRWAAGATIFTAGIAQASWTAPSVASIFTSLHASVHRTGSGLEERREIRNGQVVMVPAPPSAPHISAELQPGLVTLAEVFREAGYRTAAFVANGIIAAKLGYAQGFETYTVMNDRQVTRRAGEWLRQHRRQPFLLYLHYMAPHAPYDPPDAFDRFPAERKPINVSDGAIRDSINFVGSRTLSPREVADLINPYDGEILFADSQVRQILDTLAELDLTSHTVVVLTADHGEEFLDHGWVWHSSTHLYEELVRVPLIVDLPGDADRGMHVPQVVMHIDLAPTLLELAGLHAPDEMQGRSLTPLLQGGTLPPRPALSETIDWGWKQAIRTDSLKLICDREGGGVEFYDLASDPREQRPLPGLQATPGRALLDSLDAQCARDAEHMDPGVVGVSERISPEVRERLRSLGYIR
jgi:arylsulfatase A-like enzyme